MKTEFLGDFLQAARTTRALLDNLTRPHGLTIPRMMLLRDLARYSAANQAELASLLKRERSTVGRLIDGLEKQGLINRLAVDRDRRAKRVVLTAKARLLVEQFEALRVELSDTLFQDVADEDLVAAGRVFSRLTANLESRSSTLTHASEDALV